MARAYTQGQRHDRIEIEQDDGPSSSPGFVSPTTPRTSVDPSLVQRMLSATVGSTLVTLLVTPLDVVRVRLQAQGPSPSPARPPSFQQLPPGLGITACCREVFWVQNQSQFCVAATTATAPSASAVMDEMVISDCAAEEAQRRSFTSTIDGLRKISRNEGVSTLWRGLSPSLVMAIPANVIYFAGYDWLRTSDKSPIARRVNDVYAPLAAGSVARVIAAMAVSPIEMLRTRMQAISNQDKGVLRATMVGLKEMVSTEGYLALWRGLSLTLWRDVPFSALYWWGYEQGRKRLNDARKQVGTVSGLPENMDLSHAALLTDSFIAGATSGAVAALVTTPFDVGKTRQQTVLHSSDPNIKTAIKDLPESRTMPRFLWHIYCTEGLNGLFKGWAARCMKVAPACAIMISSYEIGKKMASTVNERRESNDDL